MANPIHIIRKTFGGSGSTEWFWDRTEAEVNFDRLKEETDGKIELFRVFGEDIINYYIDDILNDQSEVNYELLDSYSPEDDVTWTELEFRPEGYFYIERLKASTSEYWPYRVDLNGMTNEDGYAVFDDTTETLIGVVVPSSNTPAFKASVNGHEAEQQFINLKAAVIHIATEYNGV